MAARLDESIAMVAAALGTGRWSAMSAAASRVAATLSDVELGKLPDRWSPTVSAKKAGAADLKDEWEQLWFEAMTELLYQRRRDGLSGLLELLERDEATYHGPVVSRLLRLAADGHEPEPILERVRERLARLRLPWVRHVVQEVEAWEPMDPRPLALLATMFPIQIPGGEGDTIGDHVRTLGPDRRAES